jgi:hypothetical protein
LDAVVALDVAVALVTAEPPEMALLDAVLEALLADLSDIYIVFDLKSLNTYLQYLLIETKTINNKQ